MQSLMAEWKTFAQKMTLRPQINKKDYDNAGEDVPGDLVT